MRGTKTGSILPALILTVSFFAVFCAFPVQAEEVLTLKSLLVTAQRPGTGTETGDVNQELTPAFFSIIKRDAFEGKMENLSEVIEKEAGVQVRQSGGLGSYSTVSLRGSSSDQVMVFLDGILLNDASGGGVNLSNISLADIEAIEIYRGVSPVNFGKASIGGVINIRTLRHKKGLHFSAGAGAGSFNTRQYSGFINHKPGRWDYLISADYLGSDNNFEFLYDNGTQFNLADDKRVERNNAKFDQQNILAKAGYDISQNLRLEFLNQWYAKNQGLPSWNNSPRAETSLDLKRNITNVRLIRNDLGPYHFNTSLRFDYLWQEEEYDDSQGLIGLGSQHNKYKTTRRGLNLFFEWPAERHVLSFTADLRYEEYAPQDIFHGWNPNESSRDSLSLALQDSLLLFQERLIITPGLRYTSIKDDLQSGTNIWGQPLEGRTKEEDYVSPQLGLKYKPWSWLVLKANAASYVREPSFFQLFGDHGFVLGNEDLEAEKGVNYDLGFEINWVRTNRLLSRVSCHAAYFQSNIDDIIILVFDAQGIGRSVNISQAEISGVELGVSLDILSFLRLIGNMTWQDTNNQSEITGFDGKKLPGRAERSFMGRIEGRFGGFKPFFEILIEDGMYYDRANLLETRNKEEANAGMSYLYKSLLVSFEAKNIGDNRYEDFNGYPMPGTSYYLTLKYDL